MGNERNEGFRDALEVATTAENAFEQEHSHCSGASAILLALRGALDAREARDQVNPGTWTTARPVVSGPYWLKRLGETAQVVRVEIFHEAGTGTVYEPGCPDLEVAEIERSSLWHGPMSEPE